MRAIQEIICEKSNRQVYQFLDNYFLYGLRGPCPIVFSTLFLKSVNFRWPRKGVCSRSGWEPLTFDKIKEHTSL